LGGDSKGGPISSLVPGLDGDVDRRTEIKRVPDVRVPQCLNVLVLGDVFSGYSRKGRLGNGLVVPGIVRSRAVDSISVS